MKEENVNESKVLKRNIVNVNGEIFERGRDSQLWIWVYFVSFQLVFDIIIEVCCYVGRISVKRDCKFVVECRRDGVDKLEEFVVEESLVNSGEYVALLVVFCRFDLVKFRFIGSRLYVLFVSILILLQVNFLGKIYKEFLLCDRDGRVKNILFFNWWCDTEGVVKILALNVLWDSLKQVSFVVVFFFGCVIGFIVRDSRLDLFVMKLSIFDVIEEINLGDQR